MEGEKEAAGKGRGGTSAGITIVADERTEKEAVATSGINKYGRSCYNNKKKQANFM